MSEQLRRALGFFKDCLEAEIRSQTIWNFPSSQSTHCKAFEDQGEQWSVDAKYYDKLQTALEFFTREKRLLSTQIFLQGKFKVPSFGGAKRLRKIKCPLFYFPCELNETRLARARSVRLHYQQGVINPAALQILEYYGLDSESLLSSLYQSIVTTEQRPQFQTRFDHLKTLVKEASQSVMDVTEQAYLSVERKQNSAQGSLYELENLLEKRSFSAPLLAILQEKPSLLRSFWGQLSEWQLLRRPSIPIPEVLNEAQSTVLKSAADYPLSMVSGPPGTGKSFTIACLALNEFSKGNSVLVVSQNQHAADVVRRKLIDQMGIDAGLTVLGSEQGVSPEVKEQILGMLRRRDYKSDPNAKVLARELSESQKRLQYLEERFLRDIARLSDANMGATQRKKQQSVGAFFNKKTQDEETLLFERFIEIEELDSDIKQLVATLMTTHYQENTAKLRSKKKSRQSLEAFAKSLTARNEHYQEKYYQQLEFEHVLKAMPFWFCAIGNLNRFLPLQREMFDLVVIDEATQCNMAVCLPALQRAKRAVIVGDAKQLKHVSFVSYEMQQGLAQARGLNTVVISDDFRNNSVLDYAQAACRDSNQLTVLNEHFRSHPQIIEFSNQTFYDGALKVMTERPTNVQQSIEVLEVDGKRLSKGVNKQEAQAVLTKLHTIIKEQSKLPETEVHTIGVLSFFSAQARHLEQGVFDEISLNAMRRHNIRVGTPFSFQGEERDYMLISCCVDADTSSNAYTYLNRDDVFNVAITRARYFQTVFVSCAADHLRGGSKLRDYLKYLSEYRPQIQFKQNAGRDSFQAEVCNWLTKRGVDVYKNYLVAGISIDIMAVYHGHAVAIDLIGFAGDLRGALSLTQFKLLQRAGLESFLMPYQEWREKQTPLLDALMLRLGVMHDSPQQGAALARFTDEQENAFKQLSDLSINQLNSRFLNHEEVVASEQLIGLVQRYEQFIALLHDHFIPQELTFKRYLNALNELVAYCLANLQQASVAAELAHSMFEQHKKRYGGAEAAHESFNHQFDDVVSARLSLIDEQRARLKSLLNDNEKALLQINKTMSKLNDLQVGEAGIDPVETLTQLSDRLDLYRGKTRFKD